MQKRSAPAAVGEKTESRLLTVPPRSASRGEGSSLLACHGGGRGGEEEEEEEGLWREEGGRSTLGVYARPEIQLRSIDRLRCSRQISVRCEIRRLVSLASWSRGLLASDTFDSSNRFVTRNRNFSKGDLPDSNGGETGCLPLIDNDRFGGRERGG